MEINYRYITKCYTKGRDGKIPNQITLHTAVTSADSLYLFFESGARNSSATAYVNGKGVIEQYVRDQDTSWCNANFPSNQRSLTIETWDNNQPNDPVRTDAMYESTAQLCAMWMKKYPIAGVLLNKADSLAGKSGFTLHKYFASTACPAGLNVQRIIDRALIINQQPMPTFDYSLTLTGKETYMHILSGSINEICTMKNITKGTSWTFTANKSVGNDGGPVNTSTEQCLYECIAKGVVRSLDNRPTPPPVDPCANVKIELEATKKALKDEQAKTTQLQIENTQLKAEIAKFVPETIYHKV